MKLPVMSDGIFVWDATGKNICECYAGTVECDQITDALNNEARFRTALETIASGDCKRHPNWRDVVNEMEAIAREALHPEGNGKEER